MRACLTLQGELSFGNGVVVVLLVMSVSVCGCEGEVGNFWDELMYHTGYGDARFICFTETCGLS